MPHQIPSLEFICALSNKIKKDPFEPDFSQVMRWKTTGYEIEKKEKMQMFVVVDCFVEANILLCAQTSDARFILARSYLSVPSTAFTPGPKRCSDTTT